LHSSAENLLTAICECGLFQASRVTCRVTISLY
jgi:hypothetical protein